MLRRLRRARPSGQLSVPVITHGEALATMAGEAETSQEPRRSARLGAKTGPAAWASLVPTRRTRRKRSDERTPAYADAQAAAPTGVAPGELDGTSEPATADPLHGPITTDPVEDETAALSMERVRDEDKEEVEGARAPTRSQDSGAPVDDREIGRAHV